MWPNLIGAFFQFLNRLVHQPLKVLVLCLVLLFFSLVVNGSLFQLWSLYRERTRLQIESTRLEAESQQLAMKIQHAKDPQFIELQARDRFDLVQEGDLIFVFSDENPEQSSYSMSCRKLPGLCWS
jgi:cell division protein FtsB